MSDSPATKPPRLKERLEAMCVEMIDKGIHFSEAMAQFEKCFITEVLRRDEGNLVRASERLGLHRNTLAKRIYQYKIKR